MHIMTTHQTARIHQIGLPVLIGASPLWAFAPLGLRPIHPLYSRGRRGAGHGGRQWVCALTGAPVEIVRYLFQYGQQVEGYGMSNIILLDRQAVQEDCSLMGLDRLVAEKLGYRDDNVAAYDVRYLRISQQIYEMVFQEYKKYWKQHIESGASLDSMDRCEWGFRLQAPKVDKTLKAFEVRVLPGFIVERTE